MVCSSSELFNDKTESLFKGSKIMSHVQLLQWLHSKQQQNHRYLESKCSVQYGDICYFRSGQIDAKELQRALVNGNWSNFSEEACRMMIGRQYFINWPYRFLYWIYLLCLIHYSFITCVESTGYLFYDNYQVFFLKNVIYLIKYKEK